MKWHSTADELATSRELGPCWRGIQRPYSAQGVVKLRGSIHIDHTLARVDGERFCGLVSTRCLVRKLGALTRNQTTTLQTFVGAGYFSSVNDDGRQAGFHLGVQGVDGRRAVHASDPAPLRFGDWSGGRG